MIMLKNLIYKDFNESDYKIENGYKSLDFDKSQIVRVNRNNIYKISHKLEKNRTISEIFFKCVLCLLVVGFTFGLALFSERVRDLISKCDITVVLRPLKIEKIDVKKSAEKTQTFDDNEKIVLEKDTKLLEDCKNNLNNSNVIEKKELEKIIPIETKVEIITVNDEINKKRDKIRLRDPQNKLKRDNICISGKISNRESLNTLIKIKSNKNVKGIIRKDKKPNSRTKCDGQTLKFTNRRSVVKLKRILEENKVNNEFISNIRKIINLVEDLDLFLKASEGYQYIVGKNVEPKMTFEDYVNELSKSDNKIQVSRILAIIAASKILHTAKKKSKKGFYYSHDFNCLINPKDKIYTYGKRLTSGAFKQPTTAICINDLTEKNIFLLIQLKDEDSKKDIDSEFEILKELQGISYIMPDFKTIIKNKNSYIAFQKKMKCDGKSLYKAKVENILKNFAQLTVGLRELHKRKYIHCDIKPENLLLDEYGNLFIADFGMTVKAGDEATANSIRGTLGYIPTNKSSAVITNAFDSFSVGATLIDIIIHQLKITNKFFKKTEDTPIFKMENFLDLFDDKKEEITLVIKSTIEKSEKFTKKEKSVLSAMLDVAIQLMKQKPEERLSDDEAVTCFQNIINDYMPKLNEQIDWSGIKEVKQLNKDKKENKQIEI